MTTTKRRSLMDIRADLRLAQKALDGSRALSLDSDLQVTLLERFGAERMADLAHEVRLHETTLEGQIAGLRALEVIAWDTQCHRCLGTGEYHAPSKITRNGRKVCFICGGSGDAKKVR